MNTKQINTIYLVRHGENPANVNGEFSYKKVDYSLNSKGRLQAQQTAEYFKDKHIDEIYASPLKRARETAEFIAQPLHLPVTIIEEFREVNIGSLEDQPGTDENWALHNRIVQDWFKGNYEEAFPDGENYHSLLNRMRRGLLTATTNKTEKNIVIVGHGGIFTRTIKDICPTVDMAEIMSVENHNCAITKIKLTTSGNSVMGVVQQWASIAHLHGEAAKQVSGTLLVQPIEVKEI